MFGSTYVCEQLFSVMKLSKTKSRSQLKDTRFNSVLHIATRNMRPDIDSLVQKKRGQVSGSKSKEQHYERRFWWLKIIFEISDVMCLHCGSIKRKKYIYIGVFFSPGIWFFIYLTHFLFRWMGLVVSSLMSTDRRYDPDLVHFWGELSEGFCLT